MGNELPETTQERIKADAEGATNNVAIELRANDMEYAPMVMKLFGYKEGYIAGATAWAPWKVKYDELRATIEDKIDKALHAERNAIQAKMTAMETGYLKQMQRMADALEGAIEQMKEYEQVFNVPFGTSIINGETALKQFKDGKGKEVEGGIH